MLMVRPNFLHHQHFDSFDSFHKRGYENSEWTWNCCLYVMHIRSYWLKTASKFMAIATVLSLWTQITLKVWSLI
jgi:hypothetical protein